MTKKSVPALTVLEVAKLSKPGLTALGGIPRLYIYIKPGSLTRSYVYRFSVRRTKERAMIGLGSAKTTSLKTARELAAEARKLVLSGGDPREQRRAEAAERGICQDTSKKWVRSLFTPEEPQQGLCPYASLPQDIF